MPRLIAKLTLVALALLGWGVAPARAAKIFEATLQDNAASTTLLATPANGARFSGNSSANRYSGPGGIYTFSQRFDGTAGQQGSFPSVTANGNAATYVVFVNLNGAQGAYDGLLFCRGAGGAVCGMNIHSAGVRRLGLTWANIGDTYSWNSGLDLPDATWCMAALTISSTASTLYVFTPGNVATATLTRSFPVADFAQIPRVMSDGNAARAATGDCAGAQIYDTTLSQSDLQAIADSVFVPAGGKGLLPLFLRLQMSQATRQQKHFATYGVYALAP